MDSPVKTIKERLSIEEIASSYIKLERAGSNLKAKCPFHNEKTPSFFVSPERGTYYCFGCGASGDIFTFVEEFEGLDFKGALKMLAERAGVPLLPYSKEMQEAESEKEKLYRVMEEVAVYFEKNLKENTEVQAYLKSRGLTDKTIKDFRLGFAILDWRQLYDYLKLKNFTDSVIERAGLAKKPDDKSKAMYDRFRGRIMFPIADSSGRIVAFSGRIFEPVPTPEGVGKPTSQNAIVGSKYLNSPETPIFSKNAVLYGIDKAKDSIRKNNFSILVEGQMDLIMSHQAGYRNTVAASGTALSDSVFSKENAVSNLGLVRRLSPNIVLALDADKAGEAATGRAGNIALSLGMDVKVANLPEGTDPADLIGKGGVEAWRDAIKNAKHIVEFSLDKILGRYKEDERKAGKEIKEKVLPFLAALPSSIEKAHFLKRISELSGIPEEALEEDFKKIDEKAFEAGEELTPQSALETIRRKDYIKRKLLGLALWQKTLKEESINAAELLEELADIFHISADNLLKEAENTKEDLIFEAEIFYSGGADIKKDAAEMMLNLKEEILKEELSDKMRELYLAEEAKDKEKSALIFKECQSLNSRIQDIKNNRLKK